MRNSDASILAHAPPPVTYRSVLSPNQPPAAKAEPAARGDEPALLGLRNPGAPPRGAGGNGEEGHEAHLEILAFLVGRLAVAFEANDPHTGLIVAAALEAADEAGEVEVASNAGDSRNRGQRGDPTRLGGQEGVPSRGMGAPS